MATGAAIIGAVSALGGTAYSIKQTEKQKKEAKRATAEAERNETEKLEERKKRIAAMKTRLFENDKGVFGEEVEDSRVGA